MEYLLILVLTINGVEFGFPSDNTLWTQQECQELAESINYNFASPLGTMELKAHCEVKI